MILLAAIAWSIVLLLAAFRSAIRTGVMSPVGFTLLYTAAVHLTYLLNSQLGKATDVWYCGYALNDQYWSVFGLTLVVSSVVIIPDMLLGRSKPLERNPPRLLKKRQFDLALLAISSLLVLLYAYHLAECNFGSIWSYNDYNFSRTNEFYQLTSLPGKVLHKIRKPLGLIVAAALALCVQRKMVVQSLLFCLTLLYLTFIAGVEHSKYVTAYFVTFGGTCAVLSNRRRVRDNVFPVFFVLIGLALYCMNVLIRYERSYGINAYIAFWQNGSSNLTNQVPQLIHLLFGGGRVFSESLVANPNFSEQYRVLSFSPAVSFIDGFDNSWTPDADTTVRYWVVNGGAIWVPLSAFGQVAVFGPIYSVVLWLILTAGIFILQRQWVNARSVFERVATMPMMVLIPMLYFYPLRNSIRLFYLLVLICSIYQCAASRRQLRLQR